MAMPRQTYKQALTEKDKQEKKNKKTRGETAEKHRERRRGTAEPWHNMELEYIRNPKLDRLAVLVLRLDNRYLGMAFCEWLVRLLRTHFLIVLSCWWPLLHVFLCFAAITVLLMQNCPPLTVLKVIHQGKCHSQSDPHHALSIGDRSLQSLTMAPRHPCAHYLIR